jgi:hypothetical protein
MFILRLSLWPLLVKDVGEEFNLPIAELPGIFIKNYYFHKKTKQNFNAGRYPARIAACRA